MIIWLDAQLSPALAPWIHATFGLEALALRGGLGSIIVLTPKGKEELRIYVGREADGL